MAISACRPASKTDPAPVIDQNVSRFWPDAFGAPSGYRLESMPFSPTLAHLFDNGRLVVIPAGRVGVPPSWSVAHGYAMSAIDRYGRLYHFDEAGAWWMDSVGSLDQPLPEDGWDAAWNPVQGTLEILVTEPWAGSDRVQLLWRSGNQWRRFEIPEPPPARMAMTRQMLADRGRWLIAGAGTTPLVLNRRQWVVWPDDGGHAAGPSLWHTRRILGQALDGSVVIMLDDGAIWIRRAGAWRSVQKVSTAGLIVARCIPASDQLLLVWNGDLARERIEVIPLEDGAKADAEAHSFTQISQLRINEDETGDWVGWGRWRAKTPDAPTTAGTFTPGLGGIGELAFKISGETDDEVYRARDVQLLELPPSLAGLRQDAAAYVPALGGLVIPTNEGLGLDHRRVPFSPAVTGQADPTSSTAPTIDLIRRPYRFWVFRGDIVEFMKPAYEIHPAIGHPHSYRTPDGTYRSLSWIFPTNDTLRYEYHATTEQNEQWLPSDPLPLKGSPLIDTSPGSQLYLCNPVVWGSPAQVVLVGWSGRLGELRQFGKRIKGLQDEGYTEIPTHGFVARITAQQPARLEISPLPITFCQGARLVVDSVKNRLYLVGGKHAVEAEVDGRVYHFMNANEDLWQWDGQNWRRIVPVGKDAPMKITSDLSYHSGARLLLNLTPKSFDGFESNEWHQLWQKSAADETPWPDQIGLYVHPVTLQTLGIWFMDKPLARVWSGRDWIPVELPQGPSGLPSTRENLLPAMHGDTFISIDAERVAALRMNARRDRDLDRRLTACELHLIPER
ncbi:hypothetical protein LLG95_06020 [bacterium]|nr:hypothetical protein [bacterium]